MWHYGLALVEGVGDSKQVHIVACVLCNLSLALTLITYRYVTWSTFINFPKLELPPSFKKK